MSKGVSVIDNEVESDNGGGRDDRQFDEFFDRVWPRARATAARMGLDLADAEDVALDALAITYNRWRRVQGLSYRDAWTLKVAANPALRRLKRRRRAPAAPTVAPSSVEDQVATRLAVRSALATLPRRPRQVLTLRYLADLPESEVAQALGIDVGTVKQHANRGRRALRAALTAAGDDHGRMFDAN